MSIKRLFYRVLELQAEVKLGIHPNTGICGYLGANYSEGAILDQAFRSWPHFSGCIVFPVPHNIEYHREKIKGNLWINAYGALRKDLLNHVVRYLEKQYIEEQMKCL